MTESVMLKKSKAFALRIVRLYKYLREHKESVRCSPPASRRQKRNRLRISHPWGGLPRFQLHFAAAL